MAKKGKNARLSKNERLGKNKKLNKQKGKQKQNKHSKKSKVNHEGILAVNKVDLKELKTKLKFLIRIMQTMRGKGMIECGSNERQKIIRKSYQLYKIVRELVHYEKQNKKVDIRYVNLTKEYKNILSHLHTKNKSQIKSILVNLFEPTVDMHCRSFRKLVQRNIYCFALFIAHSSFGIFVFNLHCGDLWPGLPHI